MKIYCSKIFVQLGNYVRSIMMVKFRVWSNMHMYCGNKKCNMVDLVVPVKCGVNGTGCKITYNVDEGCDYPFLFSSLIAWGKKQSLNRLILALMLLYILLFSSFEDWKRFRYVETFKILLVFCRQQPGELKDLEVFHST